MFTLKVTFEEVITLACSRGLVIDVREEGYCWRVYYSHPLWVDSTPRRDTVSYSKGAWTQEAALRDSFYRNGQQYIRLYVAAELK